jgi:5'-nucleotidase / UDP-sugar diphosphatase
MMGTLFPSLEPDNGFQLRLMKQMGYDVIGLGNHEFDLGPDWIANVIRKSASKGDIPALISTNTVLNEKKPGTVSFARLYDEKLISRKVIIEKAGLRIGIFSLIGEDAERVAPKAKPVKFAARISTARSIAGELKKQKCDIIILLSHSGITKDKAGEWEGEDVELARKVKGINLIVGGHSHTKLDKPVIVNDVPIVQTGEFGKNVGRLSVIIDNGILKVEDYRLIPVDDSISGDEKISNMIDDEKEKISEKILKPLGLSYTTPVADAGFIIKGTASDDFMESNLGPLVADAIHYYVNRKSSAGSDVSIVAAGMLFDWILPGFQTASDLFRVMPLGSGRDSVPGYPLARLYVTGKELKSILEILQIAYKSSPDNYCYYSGLMADYDPGRGFLKKIRKIEIIRDNGERVKVDFSKRNKTLYSVTADSYMLEFIGIIKKISAGLINVVPKDHEGKKITDFRNMIIDVDENKPGIQEGKEWLALISYLGSFRDTNGDGIPEIDKKYSAQVKCLRNVRREK